MPSVITLIGASFEPSSKNRIRVETHQDVVTPLLEKALAREEAKKNTDEKAQSHTGKISQEEVDKLRKELDNCVDVSDFIDKL